jgi:cyclopropane fatty-acyl-phospholipid synthase-like methyltransferase
MPDLQPEDVRRYYDVWTEKYLEFFGESIQAHRPSREEDLLAYLLEGLGLRDGQRVLDAGCGICGPARYFAASRDIDIDALTISPVQVAIALQRNENAGLAERIRVTLGDFHELIALYGRERFDVVYFLESLSHSSRPGHVIREAYGALKPGGILYIKDFFILPQPTPEQQQRALEVIERVDRTFAVRSPWVAEIENELRQAGLLKLFARRLQFTDDDSIWRRFAGKHRFDLYGGADPFECWEWQELRYQKP